MCEIVLVTCGVFWREIRNYRSPYILDEGSMGASIMTSQTVDASDQYFLFRLPIGFIS